MRSAEVVTEPVRGAAPPGGRPSRSIVALVLLAGGGLAMYAVPAALTLSGAGPRAWWVALLGGTAVLLAGTALAPRAGGRALLVVLLAGAAFRAVLVPTAPALSDDLYRYLWDGKVQVAGFSSLEHPPADPALAALRDEAIWPRINRPAQPTIYPPLTEALFAAGWRVGIRSPTAWKACMAAVDVGATLLLAAALSALGRDPRRVVAYAWNPVAVLFSAQTGHLEPLVVAALAAAVLAWRRDRPGWLGLALGTAAALKLYPLVLVAAFLRGARARPARAAAVRGAGVAGLACAVVAAGYVPLLELGGRALGYLGAGYLREESYESGGRFVVLRALGFDGRSATVAAAAALAAVAVAVLRSTRPAPVRATWLLGALLVLTVPYPWYALPLIALAVVGGAGWAWTLFPVALTVAYVDRGALGLSGELWRPLRLAAALAVVLLVLAAPLARRARRAVWDEAA